MEKNVRKILIIIYSEETSGKNIFDEFVELFLILLKKETLNDEQDFLLRCCLALFQIYLEYLVNPNELIQLTWNKKIKPIFLKKYPINKGEIINKNVDVEFLLQEIDRLANKNTMKIPKEEKPDQKRKTRLDNIRMNTIYVSSKQFLKKEGNNNKNNKDNKIKSKNKTVNENNIKKNENMKNEIFINLNPTKVKESSTIKLIKHKKLYLQSMVLDIRNGFDIDFKKRKNKSLNEKEYRKITLINSFNLYQYANEVYIKDNDDINNKKKTILIEKKSSKIKTISPNYSDEISSDKNIRYKNKKLKAISFDILLKQITSTDFLEKEENIEFIYGLSQQCFCFVKKEHLFQKILNCYNYYKKLNTPLFHLKKLINFLDLLIIGMYEYYSNIKINNEKYVQKLKNFYRNLESELLKITESKKENLRKSQKVSALQFIDFKSKRTSIEFSTKIKLLEELKSRTNNQQIQQKGKVKNDNKTSQEKKEKEKTQLKKINEEEEILNEIEYILSILDTKLDNLCYLIKDIKNHLILYNRYIKQRGNSKKINPSSIPFKSFEKNIIKYNINYFSILNYEPHEIGEALISISQKDLIKIEKRELYKAIFLKKDKEKTCPNITECITKFNKLTSFIIEDILSYDFPKARAKIIHQWIKVADYLKLRKDHNDCFAIYSALNHYIITGLQLTKKEMSTKANTLHNKIKEYCSIEGNYKYFREEMIKCAKNNEFYIPYLGILLRDISFYEANYDYIMDDGLINVEKLEKVQSVIDDFFQFKNINGIYSEINKYPEELEFFKHLEMIKEDELEILANKLEPKFILEDYPQKFKRLTNIDRIYARKKM